VPVLENPINTRFEILRTLYNLSGMKAGKEIRFYAAQINGGYYSEIYHQLLFLQERNLVSFKRNKISKRFIAALTEAGLAFMEDAYRSLSFEQPEKDEALKEIFARIKI